MSHAHRDPANFFRLPAQLPFTQPRLHPGDDVELECPQPTRAEEMAFEQRRDAVLRQIALRSWRERQLVQHSPEEFERLRRERLEEIRLVYARVAAGLPIKPDEAASEPLVAPAPLPGSAVESEPLVAPAPLPGSAVESEPLVAPASLPGRPPKGAPQAPHAPKPPKSPKSPKPPRASAAPPTGPTRYSAYHDRELPARRWPEQANQSERPTRPWVSPQIPNAQYPAPNALWPSEPVYVPVPAAPAPEQSFKRPPPTLGKIAPLPKLDHSATDGAWEARFAALDTCADLFTVLLVGINAIIQIRKEHWAWMDWQDAMPLRAGHGLLQHPLPGLWDSPLLPWQPEGTLTVLQTEVEQLIRVLEVVRVSEPEPLGAQAEALRQEAIEVRLKRLEQVVNRLRPEMNKRRAVRRVAEMLARLAWRSLESLFLPEMPTRRL